MATANLSGLKNHEGVDFIDAVLAPLFVAATLSLSGLGTIGLDNPISFYLSDVLYSASGTEITWAFIFTMVALGVAWTSNEAREWDDFSEEQAAIVGGMVLLNLFSAIVPAVSSAIESYWYVGVLLLFLNGAGYYLISYY
ncbi:hypothetical protein [Natrinema halophilum]|uniref:Uncharacterized protein n=1 Tax=Natrinema halophilum TaxID=1699371 RepID=A0A7D5KFT3_9EURY|nr:hypothetical protein [Natrinema halophilum]QLG51081.1 hypothetical protein HYG82_20725 [Natrinema halophilum]